MSIEPGRRPQCGVTLIEAIVFMIVVSVGVVGLVSVMGPMVKYSAEPMRQKQMAAIAESLLSEALHQPYTWCDPDDVAASTATAYTDCANSQDKGGAALTSATPSGTEGRGNTGPGTTLDNVADYGGFGMDNVTDAAGNNAMAGYRADIAVVRAGTALGLADDAAALAVTVTVSRDGQTHALTGYRFRYAPRY